MARPLRIEFPGAVYHVATRGDAHVFTDDEDRQVMLGLIQQAAERFDAQVLAYGLGREHYELLLFTRQANLSRLMRHLNGVYTQAHNRRHGQIGHVFQGRFKAVLVDREHLLLDACRYVELIGRRAGLASSPTAWRWSSLQAHAGLVTAPQGRAALSGDRGSRTGPGHLDPAAASDLPGRCGLRAADRAAQRTPAPHPASASLG